MNLYLAFKMSFLAILWGHFLDKENSVRKI